MEFGQAYFKDMLTRIPRKFISYFLSFSYLLQFFLNLNEFPEIYWEMNLEIE
jgi:hypothetical protein